MERAKLEYDVVINAGPDTEVRSRVRDFDFGAAVYMAAVAKFPNRNIYLRRGAQVIKKPEGEPKPQPAPPVDPNLKSWSVHLIGGRKMQHLGFVQAADAKAAMIVAGDKFELSPERRKRLAVNPAGQ